VPRGRCEPLRRWLRGRCCLHSHVGRVDATELRSLRSQRNNLFRLRVRRGRVLQRGGYTNGSIAHGLANQSFHFLQLLGRGLHIGVSQHHAPHLRRPHVAGEIDAHALLFEPREILAERPPVGLDLVMRVAGAIVGEHRVV